MAKQVASPETAVEPVKHGLRYLITCVVAVLVFAVATYLASAKTLTGWEHSLMLAINQWPEKLRALFLVASIAPESIWFGAVSVIVAFVVKMYWLAWRLAFSILVGFGLVTLAQHLVGRLVPGQLVDEVVVRVQAASFGFPSMHAMMVAVVLCALFPYLPKGWRWLVLLLPLAGVLLSRIYLGAAAPLDVIGGAALGVIIVAGMHALPRRWLIWARLDSKR